MKAISLWQPWASLYVRGRKAYETRHWQTSHRGPLIIHAAKVICVDITDALRDICEDEFGHRWEADMRQHAFGAIVGTVELIDCKPTESIHVDADERAQGNWTPGRFAWAATNAKELPRAIPYRGHQALFDIPAEVLALQEPAGPQTRLI